MRLLQAPAGNRFQTVLGWTAGVGLAIVVLGLVTGLIPPPRHIMADSSRIISIYFDGQEKVITTNSTTVGAALSEAGVQLGAGDMVEPGVSTQVPQGFFNVNVYRSRPVVVIEGVQRQELQTASHSPAEIAKAAGFTVYPEDDYTVSAITDPAELGTVGQQIVVHPATPVVINSDGQHLQVRTQQKTVGALLHERDVALGPQDTTLPGGDTSIEPNMVVTINRVSVVVQQQTVAIPHDTQTVKDPNLTIGATQVRTAGSDGEQTVTYRVHYQNGIEQSREQLSVKLISQPVTQVNVVGTKIDYSADPVELGQQLAAARGWTGDEWNALYQLWERESGWNPNSHNGSSGACGIPQAYPCSKITDHSTAGQITWGLDYVAGKYGDPINAWAHWQRTGSY